MYEREPCKAEEKASSETKQSSRASRKQADANAMPMVDGEMNDFVYGMVYKE